jgi:hypothetical protein
VLITRTLPSARTSFNSAFQFPQSECPASFSLRRTTQTVKRGCCRRWEQCVQVMYTMGRDIIWIYIFMQRKNRSALERDSVPRSWLNAARANRLGTLRTERCATPLETKTLLCVHTECVWAGWVCSALFTANARHSGQRCYYYVKIWECLQQGSEQPTANESESCQWARSLISDKQNTNKVG